MSGKQKKREAKREREKAREQARRRERQRTIQTAIVILVFVAVGGVLIALSLQDPEPEVALDDPSETPASEGASEQPSEDASAGEQPSEQGSAAASEEASADAVAVEPCEPPGPPGNANQEKDSYPEGPPSDLGALSEGTAYVASFDTTCGPMRFRLARVDAPQAVNSFVWLARRGFFNGLEFFRNEPSISILQSGSGDDSNTWDIGYTLPDELERAEALGYDFGTLAMANSGPDTAGSQFFMVYGDEGNNLQPQFTVFGELIEGEDTLRSIGAIPNVEGSDEPQTSAYINSVQIEETPVDELPEPNTRFGGSG